MIWLSISSENEANRRELFTATWAAEGVSSGIAQDDVLLETGVPVVPVGETSGPVAPEGTTAVRQFAVVGSESIGPLFDVEDAKDGDLVVRIDTLRCEPARLLVTEDAESVRLTIVVTPGENSLEEAGLLMPWEVDLPEEDYCRDAEYPRLATYLQVVHVPLDAPMGDRELVDASTGAVVPHVVPVDGS